MTVFLSAPFTNPLTYLLTSVGMSDHDETETDVRENLKVEVLASSTECRAVRSLDWRFGPFRGLGYGERGSANLLSPVSTTRVDGPN